MPRPINNRLDNNKSTSVRPMTSRRTFGPSGWPSSSCSRVRAFLTIPSWVRTSRKSCRKSKLVNISLIRRAWTLVPTALTLWTTACSIVRRSVPQRRNSWIIPSSRWNIAFKRTISRRISHWANSTRSMGLPAWWMPDLRLRKYSWLSWTMPRVTTKGTSAGRAASKLQILYLPGLTLEASLGIVQPQISQLARVSTWNCARMK